MVGIDRASREFVRIGPQRRSSGVLQPSVLTAARRLVSFVLRDDIAAELTQLVAEFRGPVAVEGADQVVAPHVGQEALLLLQPVGDGGRRLAHRQLVVDRPHHVAAERLDVLEGDLLGFSLTFIARRPSPGCPWSARRRCP